MSVAIIGMGCLFPKASNLKEFWRLLYNGEDGITDVPDTHWSVKDYFDEQPKYPDHTYCKRGGFLSPVSYDPSEFGIPPKILEATDTAQLLSLLVAKRALEDAGYGEMPKSIRERTNVSIGVTGTQELVIPLSSRLGHPVWRKALEDAGVPKGQADDVVKRISNSYVSWQESSFPGLLGNVVAGRIANRLDLGGTNCVVDAACASSTSAVNLAVLELLSGKCDVSVTGGVDTLNDIFMHMCFAQTGVLSFSSDIKPFSEDADGTVLGEGIGILVLKRLADAEKDGDTIYAVIKAVGTSSDGKSQSIYAPNVVGQVNALKAAYREAGIDPSTVELIEAHGTGTRVGDAVEFSALKEVFKGAGEKGPKCAIGSVKSNIGHTKAAAGAAGIIKAALALHHKVLPPTLKVGTPDPKLEIETSRFYLNTATRPWFSQNGHPRRSGVSSFGFGGSNFHVILEEYKKDKPFVSWNGSVEILAFSSETKEGLREQIEVLQTAVSGMAEFRELAVEAYNTRASFSSEDNYRLLIVLERPASGMITGSDSPGSLLIEIVEQLKINGEPGFDSQHIYFGGPDRNGKLAFIFPGQGSQYCSMGNDLACCLPDADVVFQKAAIRFNEEAGDDTASFINRVFPLPGSDRKLNEEALRSTDVAQPAIGCTSLLMLKFLEKFGITPDALCGHSFGELTALFAAGKIDEDTFLSLAVKRGRYMADSGKGEKGAMLAVKAPLDEIETMIRDNNLDVVLANRNSPEQGVLSGTKESIDEAKKVCKKNGFRSTPLPVAAAFHSRLVKDAAKPFKTALSKVSVKHSDIPVFSNTTGQPYPEDTEDALALLGNQILNPVNFITGIEHLYDAGIRTFMEVGPKTVLSGLVKSILNGRDFNVISIDPSSGRKSGITDFAHALCLTAACGHHVDIINWEEKPAPVKKQKMSIPISGANYRSDYEEIPPVVPATPPISEPRKPASEPQKPSTESTMAQKASKKVPPDNTTSSALITVTESLKSLQRLQTQTAETHKKFLETQSEVSKSLQKMLERTQHFTEGTSFKGTKPSLSEPVVFENQFMPAPEPFKAMPEMPPPASTTLQNAISAETDAVEEGEASTVRKDETPALSRVRDIEAIMLDVVSELTGYPVEMIELDMDIESDLGIDSIKRVEILSAFEAKMPDMPSVSADAMGTLKTLKQTIEYITSLTSGSQDEMMETETASTHVSLDVSYRFPSRGDDAESVLPVERRIVTIQKTPAPTERTVTIPEDRTVFVTDDKSGLGKKISDILAAESIKTKLIPSGRIDDLYSQDGDVPPAGGVIIIPDVDLLMDRFDKKNLWSERDEQFIKQSFSLAHHFAEDLCSSAAKGGAVFATITRMDGCFGFKGKGVLHPLHGALGGITKTAAIEWEGVCCHAVDISPEWKENDQIALAAVNTIFSKGPVEIGFDQTSRYTLELKPSAAPEGRIDLGEQDVVVITGGARGVTAACAYSLAKHAKPIIVLLGRSPLPEAEPEWLGGLHDDAEIKKAILKNDYKHSKPTPAELEKAFKRYMAAREIRKNVEKLRNSGATILYYSVDIRDSRAVFSTLDSVREKYGQIRAIVHGAGVLEDRLIKDKTAQQFEHVFDTKAKGLNILLEATKRDALKYLVLFSSVSARMGNKGQADYAAANEVLNKVAQQEAHIRGDCRIISINWGPWDGGMVSPSLKHEFNRQNIELIPVKSGAMSMLFEMMGDLNNEIEVVLGATMTPPKEMRDETFAEEEKSNGIRTEKLISIDGYPVLAAHRLNNKPVVPFALMLEWFAESVREYRPGYVFQGIDDMRLLSGIKLNDKNVPVTILSGDATLDQNIIKIPLELRKSSIENNGQIHSKATALLAEGFQTPPVFDIPRGMEKKESAMTVSEAYDKILFHGEMMHGIKEVTGLSSRGLVARILSAPDPGKWMNTAGAAKSSGWMADPLAIDSAFQMAIIWCYENKGLVSLPVYFSKYRQYRNSFPEEDITAVLEVREVNDHKMKGNFTFLDSEKSVVATITGYESVMDKSLLTTFKPES